MEEDTIKVTTEALKFGTKTLETGEKLGGFLSRVFGTLPEDVVGVVGGDWLRHVRIRNADRLAARTEEILKQRGIENKTEPMSPSVALPLLEAAQDETRDELCELWSRMLANGMDPERSSVIRRSIIDVVKAFEPLDALILQKANEQFHNGTRTIHVNNYPESIGVSMDEFELSIQNLEKLDCISHVTRTHQDGILLGMEINFTNLGREVLRACST